MNTETHTHRPSTAPDCATCFGLAVKEQNRWLAEDERSIMTHVNVIAIIPQGLVQRHLYAEVRSPSGFWSLHGFGWDQRYPMEFLRAVALLTKGAS